MFSYIYWLESKVPCIATRKSSKMMTRTRSGSHLYMLGYKDGLFFSLNYVKITYRLEYRLTGGYQQVCHDVGQVQSCDLTSFLKRFKIRAFSSPPQKLGVQYCLPLNSFGFFAPFENISSLPWNLLRGAHVFSSSSQYNMRHRHSSFVVYEILLIKCRTLEFGQGNPITFFRPHGRKANTPQRFK